MLVVVHFGQFAGLYENTYMQAFCSFTPYKGAVSGFVWCVGFVEKFPFSFQISSNVHLFPYSVGPLSQLPN